MNTDEQTDRKAICAQLHWQDLKNKIVAIHDKIYMKTVRQAAMISFDNHISDQNFIQTVLITEKNKLDSKKKILSSFDF